MAFYVAPSPQYAVPVIPVATAQAVAIPAACPVVPVQYYTAPVHHPPMTFAVNRPAATVMHGQTYLPNGSAIPTSSYTTYGQQMSPYAGGCYQQGGLPHCISR
ncbi:hypothetical protein B0T17DRAFT_504031 [Bombardia bombarda]|uniref:Uncharacterized protein n=1 Tax=Bombardia bombarda TaxID=252184 RepID=A0AA39XN10_9PEZI|nr:hypothetical protein B0T17DRAFT_504031 [Bombardia bombarda]